MLSQVRHLPLNGLETLRDDVIAYKDLILQKEKNSNSESNEQTKHANKIQEKKHVSENSEQKEASTSSTASQSSETLPENATTVSKAYFNTLQKESPDKLVLSHSRQDFSSISADDLSKNSEEQSQDNSLEFLLPGIVERQKRKEWEESVDGIYLFICVCVCFVISFFTKNYCCFSQIIKI